MSIAPSTIRRAKLLVAWPVTMALPGENTVYASARYPFRIVVPIIPRGTAQDPEPGCGSLALQPCRAPKRH